MLLEQGDKIIDIKHISTWCRHCCWT